MVDGSAQDQESERAPEGDAAKQGEQPGGVGTALLRPAISRKFEANQPADDSFVTDDNPADGPADELPESGAAS